MTESAILAKPYLLPSPKQKSNDVLLMKSSVVWYLLFGSTRPSLTSIDFQQQINLHNSTRKSMKNLKSLIAVLLISIAAFSQAKMKENCNSTVKNETNWKTYENEKYGFKFQYPDKWIQYGKSAEAKNLKGEITSFSIYFIDKKTASNFSVEYFLAPNGKQLYDYSYSQFQSSQGWYEKDSKQIDIAGTKAIVANLTSLVDGKGKQLKSPLKTIIVEFLNRKGTGEFKIQFQAPQESISQIECFEKLLSTFQFVPIK